MQDFGKAEDMGDMEWTEVMVEWVVHKRIVNAEEDRTPLWLRGFRKER